MLRAEQATSLEQVLAKLELVAWLTKQKVPPPKIDLEAEALIALEQARNMKPGVERTEAMKRAGILRNAADLQGLFFAKRGRPAKT